MKPIWVIVNPISGRGKNLKLSKKIRNYFEDKQVPIRIKATEGKGHAEELTKLAIQQGIEHVLVIGGDGSINEVVNGALNSTLKIGIVPSGSGNGIARHFGIPLKLRESLEVFEKGKFVSVDTISVNGRSFLGFSGIGFDAYIAKKFAQLQKRGFINYARLVLTSFTRFKPISVSFENSTIEDYFIVAICNTTQYGNNTYISPISAPADGLFEVVKMKPRNFFQYFALIISMFSEKVHLHKGVEIEQKKKITISSPFEWCHLDGDPYKLGNILEYEINPKSLQLIIP